MRPLLSLEGVSKTLGGRALVDGADFTFQDTHRIGLVGRNGAGKTTLLRLMMAVETPDSGVVRTLDGLRLGWVEQQARFLPGETAIAFLERSSDRPVWECAKLAARFQLKAAALEMGCTALSGGYQMRLRLVAALLKDPNLLLLDEPTNYLDLSTLLLLEEFLRGFRGAYVVVSHDRQFIKNVTTETLEIERGVLRFFPGPLETYLAKKEEELAWKLKTNKKIEVERGRMQGFVDRFRGTPTKATQVRERQKRITKLQTIQIEHSLPVAHIKIPCQNVPPGNALRTKALSVGYENKVIASDIGLDIQRGEHVVIAGNNGQGKSTLLKTLAGELPALGGAYKWWSKASVGYFAQHAPASLYPDETVEAYLKRMASPDLKTEDILRLAGDLLFRDQDLLKPTKVLSGGEKARLCLAGVLLRRHGVLILDEPTSHLDFETAEALGAALREYPGTVFLVSHDRTFVQIAADRVIEVKEGRVRVFPGTYEEYVQDVEQNALASLEDEAEVAEVAAGKEIARARRDEIQEKKRELLRIEKRMKEWDEKRSKLLAFFFENPLDYDPEKRRQLEEATEGLVHEEEKWLTIQGDIENLRNEKT